MNKTVKLTIASLIVALATTVGMAAPADARPIAPKAVHTCC